MAGQPAVWRQSVIFARDKIKKYENEERTFALGRR